MSYMVCLRLCSASILISMLQYPHYEGLTPSATPAYVGPYVSGDAYRVPQWAAAPDGAVPQQGDKGPSGPDAQTLQLLEELGSSGRCDYTRIIIYNALSTQGSFNEAAKEAISKINELQTQVFNWNALLAAFSFVGIAIGTAETHLSGLLYEASIFVITVAFLVSGSGALLNLCFIMFAQGMKDDNAQLVIAALLKYNLVLFFSYLLPMFAVTLLLLGVNMVVHEFLRDSLAYTLNGLTVAAAAAIATLFYLIVWRTQRFDGHSRRIHSPNLEPTNGGILHSDSSPQEAFLPPHLVNVVALP